MADDPGQTDDDEPNEPYVGQPPQCTPAPASLEARTVHYLPGVPLNTSCDFAMAPGGGTTSFSAYEEDDAGVGETARQFGVSFAFIRNVFAPVLPDHTAAGVPIAQALRQARARYVYDRYGLFTASNGALATWAAIAARLVAALAHACERQLSVRLQSFERLYSAALGASVSLSTPPTGNPR